MHLLPYVTDFSPEASSKMMESHIKLQVNTGAAIADATATIAPAV